MLSWSSDANTL